MPGLRTRSAGAKVSEEEYAEIEKRAAARGQNVSEWCREAMLRELRSVAAGDTDLRGAMPPDPALSKRGAGRDRGSALASRERAAAAGGGRDSYSREVPPTARPDQRSKAPARSTVAAAGAGESETAGRKTEQRREALIHFSSRSLRSAGAASSLSASLRPLGGALRKLAGLTRLPLRSCLVSTRKKYRRKWSCPRDTSKSCLRFLAEQFGSGREFGHRSSTASRRETLTGFLHAGILSAENESHRHLPLAVLLNVEP